MTREEEAEVRRRIEAEARRFIEAERLLATATGRASTSRPARFGPSSTPAA
jgi:hypothetical protein